MMDKKVKEKTEMYNRRHENRMEERKRSRLSKRDFYIMLAFVLFYFMMNMINIGSTFAPDSYWEVHPKINSRPDYVALAPNGGASVAAIHIYKSIDEFDNSGNSIEVYSAPFTNSEEGDYASAINKNNLRGTIKAGNNHTRLFKWYSITPKEISQDHFIVFACSDAGVRIMEIVLTDADGNIIGCTVIDQSRSDAHNPAAAFDEQDKFLGYKSLMSDSYFDEIYHARTAYEHIEGLKPYETTHPPLGKILIGLGIRAFGMNPFGWRIVVVIFSTLCLPVAYMLGKLLFRNYKAATLMTLFFALDGLHFVLGRIATLDVLAMFFSLSSILCMTYFFKSNILRDKAYKCFVPLAAAGVMFGVAVSVKWTGMYTGAGLFVMLLVYLARMFNEARYKLAESYYSDIAGYKRYSKAFNEKLIGILATCVVFFLLIPFTIYLLSYLPYLYKANPALGVAGEQRSLWEVMLKNQSSMLWYHSDYVLGADIHPAQSKWWQWLYNGHSVFFYNAGGSFGDGMYARIHALGNPALAYGGLAALSVSLYLLVKPLAAGAINRYRFVVAQERLHKGKKGKNNKFKGGAPAGGNNQTRDDGAETAQSPAESADVMAHSAVNAAILQKSDESLTESAGISVQGAVNAATLQKPDVSSVEGAGVMAHSAVDAASLQTSEVRYNKIVTKHRLSCGDKEALFVLFLGYLSALVPWMFVQRSTFIYHYTPAMPFLCGIIVFVIIYLYKRFPQTMRIKLWGKEKSISVVLFTAAIFTAACVVLFIMFFPLYTGLPIRVELANILFRWINFFGTHYGV